MRGALGPEERPGVETGMKKQTVTSTDNKKG